MKWQKFKMLSLKTRISLATLGIFLVGLWSLSFYVSRILERDLTRLLGEQQLSTVTMVANQINQEVESRFRALQAVADSAAPLLVDGASEVLQVFVKQRPTLHALFNGGVVIHDRNGVAIAEEPPSTARPDGDQRTTDNAREYVREVLASGRPAVGRPLVARSASDSEPTVEVVLAVPIRLSPDAAVIGVLSGIIDLAAPNSLSNVTENHYGTNGSYFLVASKYRVIVSATDKKRAMEILPARGVSPAIDRYFDGYEGASIFVNPLGAKVLGSAKRIPAAGWFVAATLPTEEAFAPIRGLQSRLLLAALALTVAAAGVIWWLLRRQLFGLVSTAQTLAAMSEERLPLQPLPIARNDEIGQLIRGFNRLIDTLGQREATLKQILDTSSVAIFLVDMGGRVTQANQRMAEMFGWPLERLVGKEYVEFVHPDERGEAGRRTLALLAGEMESVDIDRRFWRHDQSEFWGHLTGRRYYDASGSERGLVGVIADIDVRKRAEQSLLESKQQYDNLVSRIPVGIYILRTSPNGDFRLDYVSSRVAEFFDTSVDALLADFQSVLRVIHPDDIDDFNRLDREATRARRSFDWRGRILSAGVVKWLRISSTPESLASGDILWHGVIVDITERRQADERLQLAASVFTHAREGIIITATDGTILDVNESFTRITGYSRAEAIGSNPRMLRSSHHPGEFYAALWRDLLGKDYWHGEIWNRRKNGEIYVEIQTISAVRDEHGRPQHYVALFTDITPMKEHEEQLERMAHYDVLTSLPNRVLLADRLHQAVAHAHRHKKLLAVAYLDLDGFKAINDSHGHQVGDQFLVVVSGRMKKTLRESDTLARLGGDEFVAVLLDLDDIAASEPTLSRLLAAAAQPVNLGDHMLQVSASLGVAFYPQSDEVDADQLLRQADQAMYQAKLAGKNRYHFFDAAQDRNVRGHHESLQRIRHALAAGEFVLHYQPKVNMRTGALVGAEALIRWQHPEKGLLPPAAFLPLIENHSLAVDLGEWVIAAALIQMERWEEDGWQVPVSINVGARQLQHAGFVERLQAILAAHPAVSPSDLSIEVLETSALEDIVRVSAIIEGCRQLGVDFALDDFGTGYSSLTYLKRLPVAVLKIDQSFVRDMLDDPDDLTILEGVISLAGAFRRQVVAEGVETVEHGEMLLQLGCELAQGYGIARPMPATDLPAWARDWKPDARWRDMSPINRNDLPLLFASVELRAWINAMDKHLADERYALPPLDLLECRFGSWLHAEGRARYAAHPGFQAIERQHRALHELALELCALRDGNKAAVSRERCGELAALLDALIGQLRVLLRESHVQNRLGVAAPVDI